MWRRQKEKEQGAMSPDIGERSKDGERGQTSRKRRRAEDNTGDDKSEKDQIRPDGKATVVRPHSRLRHSRSRSPVPAEEARSRRPKPC